jgi:hypothetical protein
MATEWIVSDASRQLLYTMLKDWTQVVGRTPDDTQYKALNCLLNSMHPVPELKTYPLPVYCLECTFASISPNGCSAECRAHPPTPGGFVLVVKGCWCGEGVRRL